MAVGEQSEGLAREALRRIELQVVGAAALIHTEGIAGMQLNRTATGEADAGEVDRVAGDEAADRARRHGRAVDRERAAGAAEAEAAGADRAAALDLEGAARDHGRGGRAARHDLLEAAELDGRCAGDAARCHDLRATRQHDIVRVDYTGRDRGGLSAADDASR